MEAGGRRKPENLYFLSPLYRQTSQQDTVNKRMCACMKERQKESFQQISPQSFRGKTGSAWIPADDTDAHTRAHKLLPHVLALIKKHKQHSSVLQHSSALLCCSCNGAATVYVQNVYCVSYDLCINQFSFLLFVSTSDYDTHRAAHSSQVISFWQSWLAADRNYSIRQNHPSLRTGATRYYHWYCSYISSRFRSYPKLHIG